jgi:hypothetical protein
MVPQRGSYGECSVPKDNDLLIRISQSSPLKELSNETEGKHIVTVNGDPRGRKVVYNGVRPGSPGGSFTALLLLPQRYAGFISRLAYVGIVVDKKGTPMGFLQALVCSPDTGPHQCFTLHFHSPITSVVQITNGGTVCSRIYSIKSPT